MRSSLVVLFTLSSVLILSNRGQTQQPEETTEELKALQGFIGKWTSDITSQASGRTPDEFHLRSSLIYEPTLGGRMLQGIEVTYDVETPEAVIKCLSLSSYNDTSKQYVSWTFQSTGDLVRWTGNWNEDSRSLVWKAHGLANRMSGTVTQDFSKPEKIRGTMVFTAKEETPSFEQRWTQTRKNDNLPDFTRQLWSKIETPVKPIPEEVKKLQPLVGRWEAEYTQLPSSAFPRGSETKGNMTGKWILDGRFFLGRSKVEKYETIWVIGYDTEKQVYRYIRFDNRGEIEENVGEWNEDTRTFKWKVVNGKPGHTKRAVVYIIGGETVQSRITSRDADGDLLLDLRIRAKRKK